MLTRSYTLILALAFLLATPLTAWANATTINPEISAKCRKGFELNPDGTCCTFMDASMDSTGKTYYLGVGLLIPKHYSVNIDPGGDIIPKPGWYWDNVWVCVCVENTVCLMAWSTNPDLQWPIVSYWYDGYCVIPRRLVTDLDPDEWPCLNDSCY